MFTVNCKPNPTAVYTTIQSKLLLLNDLNVNMGYGVHNM